MDRNGPRRPSLRSRPVPRRPARLVVELLELRPLLSTASPVEVMTPAIAEVTPDWGRTINVNNPTPVPSALTPAQVGTAYSLSSSPTAGSGTTIAIVAAYNDPNIQADLATFDARYSLPAASLGVVNQYGQAGSLPRTDPGWSLEIAMDVEWAHAAAPGAKIVLVEANSATITDLMAAVQTASRLANVVSMSWGGGEFRGETAYDTSAYFARPNVTFVAATGDDGGASGAEWPSTSPNVVAVGGTTLSVGASGTYGGETSWSASGSFWSGYSGSTGGVSAVEALPAYQASALGAGYARGRATPDVALDANPNTGLSVYDSVAGSGQTGWFEVGGTSAGAPIWAGLVAVADQARAANHLASLSSAQTLALLYSLYGKSTAPSATYATAFHDVTSGANFAARAGAGYDLVTGLGSPVASTLIAAASTYGASTAAARVAASAAVPTSSTAVRALPHARSASSGATATPTAVTSVVIDAAVAPAAVAIATPQSRPVPASTTAASSVVAPVDARPVRPAQSPAPEGRSVRMSLTSESTPLSEGDAPGLFLPADEARDLGGEGPALADGSPMTRSAWDAALAEGFGEDGWAPAAGPSSTPAAFEAPELDQLTASPGSAALAGLAVAVWGTREYRSRRSDRRRPLAPMVSVR